MESENIQPSRFILKFSNVWKSFKIARDSSITVLKDVSKEITKGRFIILFGPSGCGKTTLLNTIIGLERPDKGIVEINEQNLWELSSDKRAVFRKENIGYIPQQQNWIKSLTVLENVQFMGILLGESKSSAKKKAIEKLEAVNMSHRTNYRPTELSAGEQQKISLARCLMNDPKIIVADEPTGNLDVKSGIVVMEILRKLAFSGTTILIVTHNPELLSYADRVFFMIDGMIKKDIDTKETSIVKIKKKINKDMYNFINNVKEGGNSSLEHEKSLLNEISALHEDKKKNIFKTILFYFLSFYMKLFTSIAYIFVYLFELIFRKERKASQNILKDTFFRESFQDKSISLVQLLGLSFRNLVVKKVRTFITIIGVSISIAFVTLLLSVGYGLEKLVIDEVAEIEQRNQVEVYPIAGSEVLIDNENLMLISKTEGVHDVQPLMNVAATMYYHDLQADIVVYGSRQDYLSVIGRPFAVGGSFQDNSENEVVISEEVLDILGLKISDAIGEKISFEFIAAGSEFEKKEDAKDKDSLIYTIVGVSRGHFTPLVFIDIEEVKLLGVSDYSSLVVTLDDNADADKTRSNIELLGMRTISVMDTITEIQDFFQSFRLGLTLVGLIAFIISILGMFNTLTVSLLERIREVGFLKIIGMKSKEVQKLFLSEALIISFSGTILGVFLGMFIGFLISLALSMISLSNGGDYVIVNSIPIYIVLGIIFAGVFMGLLTGFYPSRKAERISPLDALRYE